jgi:hypothetical protein
VVDTLRYLIGRLSQVVKVTIEVPESLLGDIYVAVGGVLEWGAERERERRQTDQGADHAATREPGQSDQAAGEA